MRLSTLQKIAVLLVLILPNTVYATDVYFELTATSKFLSGVTNELIGDVSKKKIYIKENMMKIHNLKSGKQSIILLDKKVVWNIDPTKQMYASTNFLNIEMVQRRQEFRGTQFAPMMEGAMRSSQRGLMDSLDWMPNERKSFMQDRMSQQIGIMRNMQGNMPTDPAKSVVETLYTDDSKTINGYNCYKVQILENKKPVVTSWLTNDITLPDSFRRFDDVLLFFKSKVSAELKKIKGFPIKETSLVVFDGLDKIQRTREVTKYVEKYIKESEFKPPAGYMKVDHESFSSF